MPPPPARYVQPNGLIHLVKGGRTLCGISTSDMDKKHRWVEFQGFDAHEANCKGCLHERENRQLRARGIRVSPLASEKE